MLQNPERGGLPDPRAEREHDGGRDGETQPWQPPPAGVPHEGPWRGEEEERCGARLRPERSQGPDAVPGTPLPGPDGGRAGAVSVAE